MIHSPNSRPRSIFLFLTDKESVTVLNVFKTLQKAVSHPDNALILFHQKEPVITDALKNLNPFLFTYESLLDLNYIPIVMNIVPGSNHFPVLQFFLNYQHYDHYWVVEDDVRFTGEWQYLFDFFNDYDHDFISCHIRRFEQEPEWFWWGSLVHRFKNIPVDMRIRSFNPIYRISKRALHFIHCTLQEQWKGHHEVLLPTLLYHNGYKILDFGGDGDFIAVGSQDRFYTSSCGDPKGVLSEGTMRFRPVWNEPGDKINKLYHPVKVRENKKVLIV